MERHVGYAGFGDAEVDHQEAAGPCQAPRRESLCPSSSSTSSSKAAPTPSSPRLPTAAALCRIVDMQQANAVFLSHCSSCTGSLYVAAFMPPNLSSTALPAVACTFPDIFVDFLVGLDSCLPDGTASQVAMQLCLFERPTALMLDQAPLMVKVHDSINAYYFSPIGRGGPAPPAALVQRPRVDPGPRPSCKMKSFFWDKLPENRLQGTFWQDCLPPYSALHVQEVHSLQHVTCTRCNGKMQACLMPNYSSK